MSVEIHDQIADALAEVVEGLGVKAYKWGQLGIKVPCAVIEPPALDRTKPDEAEDHLGAVDWRLDFPVIFYVEMTKKVDEKQVALMAMTFGFVNAIDSLTTSSAGLVLNDLCADAKVTSAVPFVPTADGNPLPQYAYETHVSVLTFL